MTAVEWYIKKIKEARQMCDDASMGMDIWHTLDVLIGKGEQAKEMEEQEKIDFADKYGTYLLQGGIMSAAAYNETFKSE